MSEHGSAWQSRWLVLRAASLLALGVVLPVCAEPPSRYRVTGEVQREVEALPTSARFVVSGTLQGDSFAPEASARYQIKSLDATLAACAAPTDAMFQDGFE
ncbi:hypothetical protein C7S18_11285 [Ahniella affigens]|uniref:Uncharacterized protein n=1 Tax=Ahniella affigens TaxID=2021234 RepID=A0A2P1PSD6_9GAMM|nr:hypothetical protein [Ahniella affigens]AVP97745.1 hypothetical protein C7S18_11285 [Ahniella affigens]